MRKVLIIFLFIICVVVLINKEEKQEIKVRIIPNSNDKEDMEIKEEVKNAIIYYLELIYDEDYDIYIDNINKTYKQAEKIISEKNKISISFEEHTLYNKSYNNTMVKNSECKVLYIVIGEGKGDNWWGSIYPKFLEISGNTEIEYKSIFIELYKKIKEK